MLRRHACLPPAADGYEAYEAGGKDAGVPAHCSKVEPACLFSNPDPECHVPRCYLRHIPNLSCGTAVCGKQFSGGGTRTCSQKVRFPHWHGTGIAIPSPPLGSPHCHRRPRPRCRPRRARASCSTHRSRKKNILKTREAVPGQSRLQLQAEDVVEVFKIYFLHACATASPPGRRPALP